VRSVATTFFFVHGGFGSPAELAPTVPFLEARGHRVMNVDLPCQRPDATLEDYASVVIDAMAGTLGHRILVAHSAGGATIPLVAARVPVDRMVFAAAILPQPGQSIAEALGPATLETIMAVTIDNGDGTRSFDFELLSSLVPPEERAEYVAFLHRTQRKQGMRAVQMPWPGSGIPDVPCTYVLCTKDQLISPEQQRAHAAWLGVTPIEIASEHSVFSRQPQKLAEILASLAK
jgi:pimeloyl-ACP methyl ester carboxylesterase